MIVTRFEKKKIKLGTLLVMLCLLVKALRGGPHTPLCRKKNNKLKRHVAL